MALWRAGSERAHVYLPHRDDPRERVAYLYKEGETFTLPDDMNPSRTWRPMDAAAVKICKRIAEKFLKEHPKEPDDIDDEKAMRRYQRDNARWAREQVTLRTWFGPDTYQAQQEAGPVTLHEMAKAQGQSVRVSDRPI